MGKLFQKEFKIETDLSVDEIVQRLNDLKLISKKRFTDGLTYVNSYIHGCITGEVSYQGFAISTFGKAGLDSPVLAKGVFIESSGKTIIAVKITPVRGTMFIFGFLFFFMFLFSLGALITINTCSSIFCDKVYIILATILITFLGLSNTSSGALDIKNMLNDVLDAKEVETI